MMVMMMMVMHDHPMMVMVVMMMAELDRDLGDLFTRRGLLAEPGIIGFERFDRIRHRLH